MRAARVRGIEYINVTGLYITLVGIDHGPDRFTHGSQVDGYVWRIGDEIAPGVEQSAGKVQAFLDVHGVRGILQGDAHLFGNRHEKVIEYLEHDRIRRSTDRFALFTFDITLQHQVAAAVECAAPTPFNDNGACSLDNDGRPAYGLACFQFITPVQRHVAPFPVTVHPHLVP